MNRTGLAKSSRNVNLLPVERIQAPVLYRSLQSAKAAIENGEREPEKISELISKLINAKQMLRLIMLKFTAIHS